MAEISLDLDFEIESMEEEDDDGSISSSSGPDSDVDAGELGEFETDNDQVQAAAAVEEVGRAYMHEPEPEARGDGAFGDGDREENFGDAGRRGNQDHTRLDPNSTGNWCRCGGHCRVLPSFGIGDCLCCREVREVTAESDFHNVECITRAHSFEAAILDPVSLYIAWQHFTEKWRRQARSFGARNNEKYRYVAYRQFVRWCWGVLGKDIRVQLPACVQAAVKDAYPDRGGRYKGTVLRHLDN